MACASVSSSLLTISAINGLVWFCWSENWKPWFLPLNRWSFPVNCFPQTNPWILAISAISMFLGPGQAERERSLLQQKAATTLVSSEEASQLTARFGVFHVFFFHTWRYPKWMIYDRNYYQNWMIWGVPPF